MPEELKSRLLEIGRWISVIPGGILCGFLVLFPLHWILYFTLVRGSAVQMSLEDMAPIEGYISPIISSIILVYAGARIAPRKQFVVSIILFILGVIFRMVMVFLARMSDLELDISFYSVSRLILSVLAGGMGVFLIYTNVNKKAR